MASGKHMAHAVVAPEPRLSLWADPDERLPGLERLAPHRRSRRLRHPGLGIREGGVAAAQKEGKEPPSWVSNTGKHRSSLAS